MGLKCTCLVCERGQQITNIHIVYEVRVLDLIHKSEIQKQRMNIGLFHFLPIIPWSLGGAYEL